MAAKMVTADVAEGGRVEMDDSIWFGLVKGRCCCAQRRELVSLQLTTNGSQMPIQTDIMPYTSVPRVRSWIKLIPPRHGAEAFYDFSSANLQGRQKQRAQVSMSQRPWVLSKLKMNLKSCDTSIYLTSFETN